MFGQWFHFLRSNNSVYFFYPKMLKTLLYALSGAASVLKPVSCFIPGTTRNSTFGGQLQHVCVNRNNTIVISKSKLLIMLSQIAVTAMCMFVCFSVYSILYKQWCFVFCVSTLFLRRVKFWTLKTYVSCLWMYGRAGNVNLSHPVFGDYWSVMVSRVSDFSPRVSCGLIHQHVQHASGHRSSITARVGCTYLINKALFYFLFLFCSAFELCCMNLRFQQLLSWTTFRSLYALLPHIDG